MDSFSWPHVLYLFGCPRPGILQFCLFLPSVYLLNRPSLQLLYQPSWNISARETITAGLAGTSLFFFLVRSDSDLFFFSPVSSYLLAASALAPAYGKLSDLVGRKPVLYFAILSFLVSALTVIFNPPSICILTRLPH